MKNFLFFIVGFGFASILWAAMQPSERAERIAAEQTAWYQGQHYGDSTTEAQILNYLDEQKAAWEGIGDYSPAAVIDQAAHGIAEGDYQEW